jgi:hypothetical protein
MKINKWINKNSTFCCVLVFAVALWFLFSRFYINFSMETSPMVEGMVHGPKPKPGMNAQGVSYTPFPDAEPYQAQEASIDAAKATAEYERLRLMGQKDKLHDKEDEVDKIKKAASAAKKNYQNARSAQKQMAQKKKRLQKLAKKYKKLEESPASKQNVQPISLKECKATKDYCIGARDLCGNDTTDTTHCSWNEKYCYNTYKKCHPLYGDI